MPSDTVRDTYRKVATGDDSCCGAPVARLDSTRLGYSQVELDLLPEGADLGVGCGNPTALAELSEGEVVVDLGAGAGVDCFLAAARVGATGQVIGVDMTPEMISRARGLARESDHDHVEFRLGEIEHLPLADQSADVVISNCVINLSDDKPQVFREMFRILKPGGRVAISDVVATAPLPDGWDDDEALVSCCVGGAALVDDLQDWLEDAGFTEIDIAPKDDSREFIRDWVADRPVEDYVVSAIIRARRPA